MPGRSFTLPPRIMTTECSCRVCPSPGMYALTSMPLVKRTLATFRSAEFGFLGVMVFTTVHTPRLNEDVWNFGLFLSALKLLIIAGDFDFDRAFVLFLRTNWFIVGIYASLKLKVYTVKCKIPTLRTL